MSFSSQLLHVGTAFLLIKVQYDDTEVTKPAD